MKWNGLETVQGVFVTPFWQGSLPDRIHVGTACFHRIKGFVFRSPNSIGTMVDRSMVFNNSGVMLMERGHFQAALDLFRGALESKMKCAVAPSRQDEVPVSPHKPDVPTPSSCIAKAEHHMSNLSFYLSERSTVTVAPATSSGECFSSATDDKTALPPTCRESDPYLYQTPFVLPEVTNSPSPVEADPTDLVCVSTQLTCCMIIFNLALLHHMMDMTPNATMHFYDLANALLLSIGDIDANQEEEAGVFEMESQMLLLRLAVYNNYSVCGYENCDSECMVVHLECLDRVLNTTVPHSPTIATSIDAIDPLVIHGIQSNIQSILKPERGNSAAA
jgi:hypothetical protein